MWAARNGHVAGVQELLDCHAEVNLMSEENWTALFYAVHHGHNDIARVLLDRGASTKVESDTGVTVMLVFVDGRVQVVTLLPNASTYPRGFLELVRACEKDQVDAAHTIMDDNSEIDLDLPSRDGITLFMAAAGRGHSAMVQLLIERGSSVNLVDKEGATALRKATLNGYADVVEILLRNGANVGKIDDVGATALLLACTVGHLDVARILIEHGGNVNTVEPGGHTPLMMAASHDQQEIVRLLLEHEALIDLQNSDGWSALKLASALGYLEVMTILLDNGASIGRPNELSLTNPSDKRDALQVACDYKCLDAVRILVQHGAAVDIESENGDSPLMRVAVLLLWSFWLKVDHQLMLSALEVGLRL